MNAWTDCVSKADDSSFEIKDKGRGEGGLPVLTAKNTYSSIEIAPITGFSRITAHGDKKESYTSSSCLSHFLHH